MVADDLPPDKLRPPPRGYRQFVTQPGDHGASGGRLDRRQLVLTGGRWSRLKSIAASPLAVSLALCAAALVAEIVVRWVAPAGPGQTVEGRKTAPKDAGSLPLSGPAAVSGDAAGLAGAPPAVVDPSESLPPEAPPAYAVPPPQGEPVLAAPAPVYEPEGPAARKTKGETLIFEAPVRGTGGQPGADEEEADGPVVIGARSRELNPPVSANRPAAARSALTAGTVLPAVLETVVDTAMPGSVRAVVSSEVRSSDGSRVLVPRLSRLEGQYRGAKEGGRRRAMIVWTRMVRPDGSSRRLGAASAAGKAFSEQFGAASLVSVVSGGAGGDIRIRPGEPIRVTTARSLPLDGDSR